MNPVIEQTVKLYREMPLSRKLAISILFLLLMGGFGTLFFWANKVQYRAAYTGLSQEDAAEVVARLKESKTPYTLEGGGSVILVPEGQVYDVRLTLAKDGIPKGSGVGYEIFDKTDFGTTEFVQKINRKRALQGELARTIRAFDEVKDARVMIVLPKESVFVEETKKPSASILLELKSDLDEEKIAAVAHLVASSVEDLTPQLVTIVDTAGRILFEGKSEEETARIKADNLVDTQYQYKVRFETTLANRIQTMLERIVGKDKAIVRVTTEMDFSTSNENEEIYDPLERSVSFIRSQQLQAESLSGDAKAQGEPSSVNPVVPPGGTAANAQAAALVNNKKNDTINYELSRRVRQTVKPMAVLDRVSVAAVVDGNYETKVDDAGNKTKAYVPRSAEEMKQFQDIVIKAMGYSEERQDQVSVECFPFAAVDEMGAEEPDIQGWQKIQKEYGRIIANALLVLILLLFVIRPLMKTAKGVTASSDKGALPPGRGVDMIEGKAEEKGPDFIEMTAEQQRKYLGEMSPRDRDNFIAQMTPRQRQAYLANMTVSEKAAHYARLDMDKTVNIIKGWISDAQEGK
ncbi:MAG: flagellar basal-body MS-ring/collar protein FliF [Pseudomonadota bacterium]